MLVEQRANRRHRRTEDRRRTGARSTRTEDLFLNSRYPKTAESIEGR
jgi:hypothetical protein